MSIRLTEAERTSDLLLWLVLKKKIDELQGEIDNLVFSPGIPCTPEAAEDEEGIWRYIKERFEQLNEKQCGLQKRLLVIEKDFNL